MSALLIHVIEIFRSSLGYAGYIGEGTTVAAYVAYRKEAILVPDVHHVGTYNFFIQTYQNNKKNNK